MTGVRVRLAGVGAFAGEQMIVEIESGLVDVAPGGTAGAVAIVNQAIVRTSSGLRLYLQLEEVRRQPADGGELIAGGEAGRQVGGGRSGWQLSPFELARTRRVLGLPRLPAHRCTCGTCTPFTFLAGCFGHQVDVVDRIVANRQAEVAAPAGVPCPTCYVAAGAACRYAPRHGFHDARLIAAHAQRQLELAPVTG